MRIEDKWSDTGTEDRSGQDLTHLCFTLGVHGEHFIRRAAALVLENDTENSSDRCKLFVAKYCGIFENTARSSESEIGCVKF